MSLWKLFVKTNTFQNDNEFVLPVVVEVVSAWDMCLLWMSFAVKGVVVCGRCFVRLLRNAFSIVEGVLSVVAECVLSIVEGVLSVVVEGVL